MQIETGTESDNEADYHLYTADITWEWTRSYEHADADGNRGEWIISHEIESIENVFDNDKPIDFEDLPKDVRSEFEESGPPEGDGE